MGLMPLKRFEEEIFKCTICRKDVYRVVIPGKEGQEHTVRGKGNFA
jgi:hypothetical protein